MTGSGHWGEKNSWCNCLQCPEAAEADTILLPYNEHDLRRLSEADGTRLAIYCFGCQDCRTNMGDGIRLQLDKQRHEPVVH